MACRMRLGSGAHWAVPVRTMALERGSPCPHDGARWLPWDQVRTRGRGCLFDCVLGPAGQRSVSAFATAPTLVAKGRRAAKAWPQRLSAFLVCYYTSSSSYYLSWEGGCVRA